MVKLSRNEAFKSKSFKMSQEYSQVFSKEL